MDDCLHRTFYHGEQIGFELEIVQTGGARSERFEAVERKCLRGIDDFKVHFSKQVSEDEE